MSAIFLQGDARNVLKGLPSDFFHCCILDPFSGAGTTALVCERLGLDSVSVDTSSEYIQLSKARLVDDDQRRIDEFIKRAKSNGKNNSKNGAKRA